MAAVRPGKPARVRSTADRGVDGSTILTISRSFPAVDEPCYCRANLASWPRLDDMGKRFVGLAF